MIEIFLNGKKFFTKSETIFDLKNEINVKKDTICVVDGYGINENLNLKNKMNVVFVPKFDFPKQDELEILMLSRNSPKIYNALQSCKVAICGLGGLGSNVALMLTRLGVKNLHLIDFDSVDCTNLNRQNYKISHLGMKKTLALKDEISQINPFIKVKISDLKLTKDNICETLKDDFVICEAFDNPESKAILCNEIFTNFDDKFVVAASGMAGFGSSNDIKTKKINEKFYICGDFKSGAKIGAGLMSPRVNLVASHQANMILRIILKEYNE